jgi:hypothetical protein
MLRYITSLSTRLQVLHLRRKLGPNYDDSAEVKGRFWLGVLGMRFPRLESFAIQDQSDNKRYELDVMGFWERHPGLYSVEVQLGSINASSFPSSGDQDEVAPFLPKLQYLTVRPIAMKRITVLILHPCANNRPCLGSS